VCVRTQSRTKRHLPPPEGHKEIGTLPCRVLIPELRHDLCAPPVGASAEKQTQTNPFGLSLNHSVNYVVKWQNKPIEYFSLVFKRLELKTGRFLQSLNGFDVRPMNWKTGERRQAAYLITFQKVTVKRVRFAMNTIRFARPINELGPTKAEIRLGGEEEL